MQIQNCRGLIFDLDGVIVHTDRYHYRAWKTIADRLGIPFDETVNNRLRGVSRAESLAIILEGCRGPLPTEAERERLAEEKNRIYRQSLSALTPADADGGVRETLATLRARGYRLAIGSSSRNAGLILDRLDLRDAFDNVTDGNAITHSKPDPEVFLTAAKGLGLKPEACAVIEDATAGITAAKMCGMTAIAIGDATKDPRADVRLERISDLIALFGTPAEART